MILPSLPASPFVVPEPAAGAVTFQIIAPLPALSESETAATEVLAQVMSRQTQEFSPGRVLYILSGAGDAIHWDLTPDHLRFSFTVPKVDESLGFTLLSSFLERPAINEDSIAWATHILSSRRMTPWQVVLAPACADPAKVRGSEITRLYQTLIRPERIVVAIGGEVDQVTVQREFSARLGDWKLDKPRRAYVPVLPLWSAPSALTIVDLPGISAGTGLNPADMLAAFALGCGKGASVFRSWRESEGWSYLQAAGVKGQGSGLALDAWFATKKDSAPDRAKGAAASLKKDVESWTEEDRTRALAMAESVLIDNLVFGVFWFDSDGPLRNTLEDRTFMAAFWKMRTGEDWDPRALLDKMRAVTLDNLKMAADGYLDHATPRILG